MSNRPQHKALKCNCPPPLAIRIVWLGYDDGGICQLSILFVFRSCYFLVLFVPCSLLLKKAGNVSRGGICQTFFDFYLEVSHILCRRIQSPVYPPLPKRGKSHAPRRQAGHQQQECRRAGCPEEAGRLPNARLSELSRSVSFCLVLSLCLSVSLSLSLPLCLSLPLTVQLSLSLPAFLCLSLPLSVSFRLSLYIYIYKCVSFSLSLNMSLKRVPKGDPEMVTKLLSPTGCV